MVKKLIKYEMLYYLRTLLPAELILLGMALLVRFVQFFENDSIVYSIVSGSSLITYVVAILVLLVMMFVMAIKRFYQNLYTAEGYLSFTLPVTHSEHIFSKLFSAVVMSVITGVIVISSVFIATAGELAAEIMKAGTYLFKALTDFASWHSVLFIIEFLLYVIVSLSSGYLLYYTCITAGQMAKKNRVLAAFGAYFAYYIATQAVETFFVILTVIFNKWFEEVMTNIGLFVMEHPIATVHIVLISLTVFSAIFGALYFFLTHLIMKKRLNLE